MSKWFLEADHHQVAGQVGRFVATQPILDRNGVTFGYELLFRDGWENCFRADGEIASRSVIDSVVSFGLESLVGNTFPFINCTGAVLRAELPRLLPRNAVLEVLEDVVVDCELLAACRRLRAEGFRLALDDFNFEDRWNPLLECADFVKVDLQASTSGERQRLLKRFQQRPMQFVAEKVEDGAELQTATREGFHLFQGYFFTRPVVVGRPALAHTIGKMRLLSQLRQPELDYSRVLTILKEEPGIAYRLMRLANSVAMARREPVVSLDAALMLVGEEQFRMLTLVAVSSELCGKQPMEAHRVILQTARFCELMSSALCRNANEMFIFGMLSVVQSILNLSTEDLSRVSVLNAEMLAALSGGDNSYGRLLRCSSSYDMGDWDRFRSSSATLGCAEGKVFESALAAREWADNVLAAAA
jgi:c-di-GMP phosphodiesterase